MGILGITNRTENWKTAEYFCGLPEQGRVNLVRKLSGDEIQLGEVKLELFWYGMRDYVYEHGGVEKESVDYYVCKFSGLRERIKSFEYTDGSRTFKFSELQPHNYDVSTRGRKDELYSNLRGTEIDIVLETSEYLFIGEAKDESGFGANGKYALVHQLIREYVMARILVDIKGEEKKVVPFIVGDPDSLRSINNTSQVRFMICQDWLKECNIMSWNDIKKLG